VWPRCATPNSHYPIKAQQVFRPGFLADAFQKPNGLADAMQQWPAPHAPEQDGETDGVFVTRCKRHSRNEATPPPASPHVQTLQDHL
jgi:hypothetical protein